MNRTQSGYLWLFASIAAAIVAAWLGATHPGEDTPPVIGALVWSGRLAFLVFLIPLFASPARELFKNTFSQRLLRWRRNAGVAYGGIQIVHLCVIIAMFVELQPAPVESAMVAIGGLGIALALGMLVTSFDGPTRRLGRVRWRRLHKAGFYVFMFIYFYDFVVEPLLLGTFPAYAPFAALTLSGMILRTIAMLRRRGQAAALA